MTISEVGRKFELSNDTLRYYEKAGLIPEIGKGSNGIRNYTESDIKWVGFIKCMRSAGLPIDMLVKYVSLFQKGDETADERKALLIEQRDNLIEKKITLEETIERLNLKIQRYESAVRPAENELMADEEEIEAENSN